MKKTNFYLVAALLLLFVNIPLYSQILMLRNFPHTDYRGGTQNWDIDKLCDNRMVFANNNGLMIFDGDKWDIHLMPNITNVRSVLYDKKQHVIYAGATDEFGYFEWTGNSNTLQYRSLADRLPKKRHRIGEIWQIFKLGEDILFRTRNEIFVYHRKADGKESLVRKSLQHDIDNISVIGDKAYISCKEACYMYWNGQNTALANTGMLRGKNIRAVLTYGNQLMYVTATHGLFLYDGQSVRPYRFDISDMLMESDVFCATSNGKYIAFGTVRNGLIIKDLKKGTSYYANAMTGLQNNTVLSMKFDEDSNLWLGLDNGVSYIITNTPLQDLLPKRNSIGTGYASVVSGDKLYLGTNQGLFYVPYPLPENAIGKVNVVPCNIKGQIWSIRDIDGTLLCGTNNGAYVIHDTKAEYINGPIKGTWDFIPLAGHPGYILACDYSGLIILKREGKTVRFVNRVKGFDVSSGRIEQDADGSIWMSHWKKGVYHLRLSADMKRALDIEFFNKGNGVVINDNNLVCKIDGRVYVSSVDGFKEYDRKKRSLVTCDWMNRIFNTYGVTLRVIETPEKDLLAYKPGYMAIAYRQGKQRYKAVTISNDDVIDQLQMGLGHVGFMGRKRTLFNCDNGFYVMNNNFTEKRKPGHLIIRSIRCTTENDSILYSASFNPQSQKIEIPHKQSSIRIEFVMPVYRRQNAVQYQCYLENYDKEWGPAQTNNSKEYTQLSKGEYIFHVKAINLINGTESESQIVITVLPAWYETWWAYVIYTIIALCLILAALRYQERLSERKVAAVKRNKEREMKEQEAQFRMAEEKKEAELIRLRNKQLEVELKHKSSELADSTMNLVRKNDMLQAIDTEMQELLDSVRRDDTRSKISKKIGDIRHGIQSNMTDDNWDKFEENFNLVYDNFMQRLMTLYPDLKRNDLRLCAFLRMGLSSKEMASLMNTSVRSIETARYRLRKKLGIDSGDNLTSFIQMLGGQQE